MAAFSSTHSARPGPWVRLALWAAPIFFLLLIGGFFVVRAAIDSYLRSDGFRQFIARKAGGTMHADAELSPLHFSGTTIFADGFRAKGGPDAAFAELHLEQIRTEISLRRFFEQVWQIEQFDVQRLRVNFDGPRAARPPASSASPLAAPKTEGRSGWMPNRVEVGRAIIRDTQLQWPGGSLRGTVFDLQPHEGGWQIAGQGGRIEYGRLPPLDVAQMQLRYRAPSLFVNSAEFRQPGGGSMQVNGEVNFERQLDLRLTLANVDISPYLSDDWRVRLKGTLTGEIIVDSALPSINGPKISGTLKMSQGELTALPVLDQIAAFTRTQQFRRIHLSNASGDFAQEGSRLTVKNFVAESEGLIRLEGAFVIENARIEGDFLVGVTPSSLQWLPGSQGKVFTESRKGYVWAPMRLAGPLNQPSEDLTARLAAAAGNAVIEGAQNAAGEAMKTGKDVIKGALDLLLPNNK